MTLCHARARAHCDAAPLLSYSYGSLGLLSLSVTLTLDGIACSAFGADEARVLRDALATTLGYDDSYFSAMTCADASSRRLRSGARRLGTTSSAITFEVSVPGNELDDGVASADDFADGLKSTLTAAINDGSLAANIAAEAASAGVTSMSNVDPAGIAVSTFVDSACAASFDHASGEIAVAATVTPGGRGGQVFGKDNLPLASPHRGAGTAGVGGPPLKQPLYRVSGVSWSVEFDSNLGDQPAMISDLATVHDDVVPGELPGALAPTACSRACRRACRVRRARASATRPTGSTRIRPAGRRPRPRRRARRPARCSASPSRRRSTSTRCSS